MKGLFFTAYAQFNPFLRYAPLSIFHTILGCTVASLMLTSCRTTATNWWSISDKDFAEHYVEKAFSSNLADQSSVAWMLFLRVNQQKQSNGKVWSEWELWPSNDDTFNPIVEEFAPENKVRTRPDLQAPKLFRALLHAQLSVPPDSGGEEVTRNSLSYRYILDRGLNTKAGVWKVLSSENPIVDFPIGTIEIKADWSAMAVPGTYQITDSTNQITYSLLGLHIMAKMAPVPKEPFFSEQSSWFWTTFEFNGNPGLANAQSLVTYRDALATTQRDDLLSQAGLSDTPFVNYRCNGTQIRYSDQQHPEIILGNTTMEDFAGVPKDSPPAGWSSWNSSCHTCHGTTSGNPETKEFYPFTVPVGKITDSNITTFTPLDFVWSIAFHAK
jgi:hypothetical protein